MILDRWPEAVRWLPEEADYLRRLAESSGGHYRARVDRPRNELLDLDEGDPLYPVWDVLVDLAEYLPEARRTARDLVVTVNATASDWHRDARSYRGAVIAWIVRGRVEGGRLLWRDTYDRVQAYAPQDGDVARIDGVSYLHRIEPWEAPSGGFRGSVVLA